MTATIHQDEEATAEHEDCRRSSREVDREPRGPSIAKFDDVTTITDRSQCLTSRNTSPLASKPSLANFNFLMSSGSTGLRPEHNSASRTRGRWASTAGPGDTDQGWQSTRGPSNRQATEPVRVPEQKREEWSLCPRQTSPQSHPTKGRSPVHERIILTSSATTSRTPRPKSL